VRVAELAKSQSRALLLIGKQELESDVSQTVPAGSEIPRPCMIWMISSPWASLDVRRGADLGVVRRDPPFAVPFCMRELITASRNWGQSA